MSLLESYLFYLLSKVNGSLLFPSASLRFASIWMVWFFSLIIFFIIYCSALRFAVRKIDSLALLLLTGSSSLLLLDFDSTLFVWYSAIERLVMLRLFFEIEEAFERVFDLDLLFSGNFYCSTLMTPWKVSRLRLVSLFFIQITKYRTELYK